MSWNKFRHGESANIASLLYREILKFISERISSWVLLGLLHASCLKTCCMTFDLRSMKDGPCQ